MIYSLVYDRPRYSLARLLGVLYISFNLLLHIICIPRELGLMALHEFKETLAFPVWIYAHHG